MRLRSMSLTNFRVHADTSIDFQSGLTAIVGQNESGKSSILEALTWAIYGGQGVRGSVKTLRWRNARPRKLATVEVCFSLGDTDYLVRRTETNAKVHSRRGNDEWAQVADGTKGVTEYLTARIGMSLPEFSSTYLCGQKDVARLATMGAESRRKFVRRIMGAEKLDGAVQDGRKAARDAASQLKGMESLLGDGDERRKAVTAAEAYLVEAKKCVEDAIFNRDACQHGLEEYEDELRDFETAKTRVDEADRRLAEIGERFKRETGYRREAMEREQQAREEVREMETLEKEVEPLEALTVAVRAMDKAAATVADIRAAAQRYDEAGRRIAQLDGEIMWNEAAIDAYDSDVLVEAHATVEDLQTRLRDAQKQRHHQHALAQARVDQTDKVVRDMEKALGSGICPSCAQPLKSLEEVRELQANARAEGDAARRDVAELRKMSAQEKQWKEEIRVARDRLETERSAQIKADNAERTLKTLRQQKVEIQASRKATQEVMKQMDAADTNYDPQVHEDARRQLRVLERKDARLHAIGDSKAVLEYALKTVERHNKTVAGIREEAEAVKKERDAIIYEPEHHKAVRHLANDAKKALEGHRRALAAADKEVVLAEHSIESTRQRLQEHEELERKVAEGRSRVTLHETVRSRLEEFRGTVLDTIRPDIAMLVSGFLAFLTDGRHEMVDVDDSFGIQLWEAGEEAPVVSGGTEDVVWLAMRIALSQLISERSGQPLSLLILDEPFGSLDAVRRGNVLALLDKLRDTFEQVVMISHVEETREAADQTVELLFDPDAGRARVS